MFTLSFYVLFFRVDMFSPWYHLELKKMLPLYYIFLVTLYPGINFQDGFHGKLVVFGQLSEPLCLLPPLNSLHNSLKNSYFCITFGTHTLYHVRNTNVVTRHYFL